MSINFKDNLVIDNGKYIRWLNSTGTTRANILSLDSSNNTRIQTIPGGGGMYVNSDSTASSTFINIGNASNTVFGSKIGVGVSSDSNINANITLLNNSYIGLANTQGGNSGYLALSGAHTLTTEGSRLMLWGVNTLTSNAACMDLYTGNNTAGSIRAYTGSNSLKFKIDTTGIATFTPNGSTTVLTVASTGCTFTQPISISNTTNASGVGTGGSMTILGGTSISRDLFVGGTVTSSSDRRLKRNIVPLGGESFLEKIKSIVPVTYIANNDPSDTVQYGFIAQDFEKEFPELVKKDLGGIYSLDYQKVTVLLVKCIQELAHVPERVHS